MKRILTISLILLVGILCHAASPYVTLACEKIFQRKDIRAEGHEVVTVRQPANYFRSVTAEKNKKLLDDIKKAFEQDRKKALNSFDSYDGNEKQNHSVLNIESNGYIINVGLTWDDNGYVNLFLQSDPKAFK